MLSHEIIVNSNNKIFTKLWGVYSHLWDTIWMNEWYILLYSALLCIFVHPKRFTIMWGGVSPQPPPVSTWMMRQQPQDNGASMLTTHQLQVERRVSHRANQVDGDYWEVMIDKGHRGNLARTPGLHPYSLREVPWDFFWPQRVRTLVSRLIGKTVLVDSIVSPSLYWGIRTHTDHRVSTPCWPH